MATGDHTTPIAIIGMGCRFSGNAASPEKLWDMLTKGENGWSQIPKSRFWVEGLYHPNSERVGTTHVGGGHFLKQDIASFDASFFNISSHVASSLDPQYRLELEVVYEALESAGIPLEKIMGSDTSTFGGIMFRDYHDSLSRDPDVLPRYFMTGNAATMASNRISHFYDLHGPSMSVDTGCSTTLTALHLACQNLRAKESTMSIVTGASLMLNPDVFISMSSLGFLSPDGQSYAFDSRANGYGRGEGVAAIILKRLDEALQDGDPIRAVIRETALNQDGRTPTITTPSQTAQIEMIQSCYRRAGLDPAQTSYVEAHGTGTPTGDPLEVGALSATFCTNRSRNSPLYIGSVKSNIGHTEATSGLASIIKTTLALERGLIPPNGNFQTPNPKLNLDGSNIKVPTSVCQWPAVNGVRRASVNNFGFGGANAHAILEWQSPHAINPRLGHRGLTNGTKGLTNGVNLQHDTMKGQNPRLYMLSAKDEQACHRMASDLREYLLQSDHVDESRLLKNLAYTLGSRRSRLAYVAVRQGHSLRDLAERLGDSQVRISRRPERAPRLGWVFTGQGAQWFAMGRELLTSYPVFKEAILECDRYIQQMGSTWTLMEELQRNEHDSKVNSVQYSLPMSTAVQIALVRLLRSWGIEPVAVTSHSSGEIAAAYAAGALDVRPAIGIAYLRGALVANSTGTVRGGMIAVGLGRTEADEYISRVTTGKLVVACVNSQSSVTISGDLNAIIEIENLLQEAGVFARRLKVSEAFHSDHMLPVAGLFTSALMGLLQYMGDFGPVIFSSPRTGRRVTEGEMLACPTHWVESMLRPVEFESAFRHMCFDDEGTRTVDVILEVGPHGALGGPIQQLMTLSEFDQSEISYLPCLVRGKNAVDTMHHVAMELIHKGYHVDLDAINFPHGKSDTHVLTDLPTYPWNHQHQYWMEPRVNKCSRQQRTTRPHDLVGMRQMVAGPFSPTWRHIIRAQDVPWVRDHLVQSQMVYPGAGFLSMALEGMNQLLSSQKPQIDSYDLRNVEFARALIIPDNEEGVEVQLTLVPCEDRSLGSKGWHEFRVVSVSSDNSWTAHCTGLIQVNLSPVADTKTWGSSMGPQLPSVTNSAVFRKRTDPAEIWSALRSVGIEYGPTFRNLTEIQCNRHGSLSTFSIADTKSIMPNRYQCDHIVHPSTLDSLLQAAYTTLPAGGTSMRSAFVPRAIERLRLSGQIQSVPGHQFKVFARLDREGSQAFQTSLSAFDENDTSCERMIVGVSGLVFRSLGGDIVQHPDLLQADICSTWKWELDLSLSNNAWIKERMKVSPLQSEIDTMKNLRRAAVLYISDAISALTPADIQQLSGHHKRYYVWMKEQLRLASENRLAPNSSSWLDICSDEKQALLRTVASGSTNGEMISRLGPQIVPMLRNEVAPLELMLQDKLLARFYADALKWSRANKHAAELVALCAHKWPRANILEIGGGTGSCTQTVLDMIEAKGLSLGRYDFTDLSTGFFKAARERLSKWTDYMTFNKLDIEIDPTSQGFNCGTYDVVVACQVLHATKNMDNTMDHVRKLLKPGGKLILVETTKDELDLCLTFGLLPGWWLSEEPERQSSPSLTIPFWQKVLKRNGFTGLELELHDYESEEFYQISTAMSTALSPSPSFSSGVTLVIGSDPLPTEWLKELQAAIAEITGKDVAARPLKEVSLAGTVCIFLGELTKSCLVDVCANEFESIVNMAARCSGLLWVSCGGALDCKTPQQSLHLGLLRTLRAEYSGKRYVSLDIDPQREPWTKEAITSIKTVFQAAFNDQPDASARETEYAERNGGFFIPRALQDQRLNSTIAATPASLGDSTVQPFCQSQRPVKLAVGTPGLLDSLYFTDDWNAVCELDTGAVEIEARAYGLNFRDVMVAMGQLDADTMGFECSGIITRVGQQAVAQGFKVGDRVCALLQGGWCTRPRAHWTNVVIIRDDLSFEEAASFPLAFATAYVALRDTARLQAGEKVLIHSATGGVGQAAVTIAQWIGAEIFVTVGSQTKREFITEKYQIPSDHIFSSRDPSFAMGLLAKTDGHGVDVVLNSLSGRLLQESFNCLCEFGRFVEIGKRDLELNSRLDMHAFTRNVSFSSIDLLKWGTNRKKDVARVMKEIGKLLGSKVLAPISPITTYPIESIENAFRTMQAGQHIGKIVLTIGPESMVPVVSAKPAFMLQGDETYLIVGGLGGLGSSICEWMVEKGARNLIVMSRTPVQGPFLLELQKSCNVRAVACDVTDSEQLKTALQSCADMPPIRGVIQGAMVLQDAILEQMTVDNFKAAVGPKVHGSWNLHQQLQGLDFFVMLSSLVGVVGGASQANYAAGGAFQDALATYRRSQGLPAVTIDLGMIKQVGYVAVTKGVAERLAKNGYKALDEHQVLRILEAVISSPSAPQVITGINTGPGPHWDEAGWMKEARMAGLKYQQSVQTAPEGASHRTVADSNLRSQLSRASSLSHAAELILHAITSKLSSMFSLAEEEIDPTKGVAGFGVDSLIAVELRNWVASQAASDISIFELMQSPSLTELAMTVATRSSQLPK
ncbi:hypothetical protein CDV55_100373 [Aspergillus turcosus]|nr:hypothetical protein CDV55_100373 [Aspergillus turcosus]